MISDGSSRLSNANEIWYELREIQRETSCSTKTLTQIFERLRPYLKIEADVKIPQVDKQLRQQGIMMQLHGCVGCNAHVFTPDDTRRSCPDCDHPRFDRANKPNEVCWYFPLRSQLAGMLSVPEYRQLLQHEYERDHNDEYMSDVYDTPRWQEIMGPATRRLKRIGVQYCIDGAPTHNRKGCESMKPIQCYVLNLPPWIRYRLVHMIVQMLIPARLKGQAAKKYYDFASSFEMNELHRIGINGVRVIMFGITLDTPGRREILSMQSCEAFYPCPHCLHTWQPGLRGQVYGGYRCFLPPDSPWRNRRFQYKGHTYMFRDQETRAPPEARTPALVTVMVSRATIDRPFCGHKMCSLLNSWVGHSVLCHNCDPMHDVSCFVKMLMKGLVGQGSVGMYKNWSGKDDKHRADCLAYGIFQDFARGIDRLPPWRLTRNAVNLLDLRVRSMWTPHYVEPLVKDGHSFFTHSDRMWKCKHKSTILLVLLPTLLHGLVPAVHEAILLLVWSLRRLEGQVLCVKEALDLGVTPGSRHIKKTSIPEIHIDLIRGLVLLEGCFPVAHLNPALHHLVHYAMQTMRFGILDWYSMFVFERNNKRLKGLVRTGKGSIASLAHSIQVDISTRQKSYVERGAEIFRESSPCRVYHHRSRRLLSALEKVQLGTYGVTSFRSLRCFHCAQICGVHFKSGEWGRHRCGSVVTLTYGGHSQYCVLKMFIRVQGKEFACVDWLSEPEYPYAPNLLVVRVSKPAAAVTRNRIIIPIDRIDPCCVYVLPDPDGVHYWMMRSKGTDRVL